MARQIAFAIVAAVTGIAAVGVVTARNVIHAALSLAVALAGTAAVYILLAAEFVAVVQVLVYIGAVAVLFVFGVMLVKPEIGRLTDLTSPQWYVGALVAALLGALLTFTLVDGFGDARIPDEVAQTTGSVGDSIFSTYLVPFEAVSVLLLAALVGAIVLARRE